MSVTIFTEKIHTLHSKNFVGCCSRLLKILLKNMEKSMNRNSVKEKLKNQKPSV